ncbi:hypothetical protein ABT294_18135 [Nonomuraea sp. NPDC000554]|uniref:hypothetical protein n=1 Tax=Nonomuraea sp. NPDC000554 TaxID=3154259 RepID=UPI0033305FFE
MWLILKKAGRGARGGSRHTGDAAPSRTEDTPDDAAFLRMMAGAAFDPHVTVTLPSGKTILGEEMTRWLESQRGDAPGGCPE